jgi:hypothetical protein
MYAVVNQLHFNEPVAEVAEAVWESGLPLLRTYRGFQDFYLVKVDETRAMMIILWDCAENARSGAQQFGPTWLAQNIIPHLASDQQRSTGEILVRYEP